MTDSPDDKPEEQTGGQQAQRTSTMERRHFTRGQYIFREEERGEMAFLVVQGEVEIVKTTTTGETVLGTVQERGLFGEMALIGDKPRIASARAATDDVELMVISRSMFEKKMSDADPFLRALVKIFADHIRTMAETISRANTRAS